MGVVPYITAILTTLLLGGCAIGPTPKSSVHTPQISPEARDLHDFCRGRIGAGTNHTTIIGGGATGSHYDSEDLLVAMMTKQPFRFLTRVEFDTMTRRTAREFGVNWKDVVTTVYGNASRTTVIVHQITPNLMYAHAIAAGNISCGTWIVERKRVPLW